MKDLTLQLKNFEIKSRKIFLIECFEFFFGIFSLKTRENALRTLQIIFSQKYLPEQVANRYENKSFSKNPVLIYSFLEMKI